MAVVHSQLNVKTATGYDQLYLQTDARDVLYTSASNPEIVANVKSALDAKPDKSKRYVGTLSASSWIGEVAPYTQTITIGDIGANKIIIVGLPSDATNEQQNKASSAWLWCTSCTSNSVTITAFGAKPDVSIPIQVVCADGSTSQIVNTFSHGAPYTRKLKTLICVSDMLFTPPATAETLDVLCVGGGGDGSSVNGGGGGGGHVSHAVVQNPSSDIQITIGQAGVSGNSGGVTSFGMWLSANGGSTAKGNSNGGDGGSGGGGHYSGGNATFGGGGGGGAYLSLNTDGEYGNGGKGGNGGTYGGGGGGGYGTATSTTEYGAGGTGGENGGSGGKAGSDNNNGIPGTDTTAIPNIEFTGTGLGGVGGGSRSGGGGGGGYGGNGGAGYSAGQLSSGGGGGGYGGNGGNGSTSNGGGGGGYGGRGANATSSSGGGGGGYGIDNYGRGSGGEFDTAKSGICIVKYWDWELGI